MYNMHLVVGPAQVHLETDEKLSFDGVETLLNRGTLTALTLLNAHMAASFKYEQEIEKDYECDECAIEELNNNNNEEI